MTSKVILRLLTVLYGGATACMLGSFAMFVLTGNSGWEEIAFAFLMPALIAGAPAFLLGKGNKPKAT